MLQAAPRMTLVLGGARSGKSAYAERLIEACPAPWLYIATAQAWDDEMRARIHEHRARRSDAWRTLDVPAALPEAVAASTGPVLVDCLTLWLTNLLLAEADLDAATEALARACAAAPGPLVLVANEVGLGIVPDNALARRFRDAAGRLHQRLARDADRVVLTVAGLPLTVKPSRENPA
ncbi:bifunctional adenosylcobinamide kinase/adenosylcobinamide-phosphate guanylyltransferase [Methylorubrum podarium]|jgi:adenosylcobinamide kinase / adenosylcobinamide-phosphate guanylyltransferase|uniref:bifunctional adenosylcobinamide kinase/adenosylcobinamide-phosphate guanylyltransferase n=1 Tax=Methylorubrum podarium TaxID=200476 RepID=UPI001EE277B8|nr:bifunctional adenosylcobinamide kinase/adenosylcobinamide-phosphate guanylyltransferase [Methylorubrum podarium]GJE71292.1 Bifunctional adenosylcobalamin biosynthesis protein CobP [Methylorubrum podarium]